MFFLWFRPKRAVRRKVFVSYHHAVDQPSYLEFVQRFATRFETVTNRSIEREVDSERPEYVMRKIREEHIRGSSCIIVLCGRETPWRKYIDWEIKAALDREHCLIGINLPGNRARLEGKIIVPGRLHDNIQSGYAVWIQWPELEKGPKYLQKVIELACSKPKRLIDNRRPMRERNGSGIVAGRSL